MLIFITSIICFLTISGISLFRYLNQDYNPTWKILIHIVGSAAISLAASFIIWLILASIISSNNYVSILVNKHNIISVQDNSNLSGQFCLGSGTIKTQNFYYYYQKETDSSITQHHINVKNTKIFEIDSTQTPRVEFYIDRWNNDFVVKYLAPFFLNSGINYNRWNTAILYIPKNSIIK